MSDDARFRSCAWSPEPGKDLAVLRAAAQLAAARLQARSLGVFLVRAQNLELVLSDGLTQDGLDVPAAIWRQARRTLAEGIPRWVRGDKQHCMVLPGTHAGKLHVLAYVELPKAPPALRLSAGRVQVLIDALGLAAASLEADGGPADGELHDLADEESLRLQLLLEQREWNVSAVARTIGVTRMTVYNRMRKLKIARRRVMKTKAGRAHGSATRRAGRRAV